MFGSPPIPVNSLGWCWGWAGGQLVRPLRRARMIGKFFLAIFLTSIHSHIIFTKLSHQTPWRLLWTLQFAEFHACRSSEFSFILQWIGLKTWSHGCYENWAACGAVTQICSSPIPSYPLDYSEIKISSINCSSWSIFIYAGRALLGVQIVQFCWASPPHLCFRLSAVKLAIQAIQRSFGFWKKNQAT